MTPECIPTFRDTSSNEKDEFFRVPCRVLFHPSVSLKTPWPGDPSVSDINQTSLGGTKIGGVQHAMSSWKIFLKHVKTAFG